MIMTKKNGDGFDKKPCQTCGGSGQISGFQGVSRFLLSWEECPECCGLGYVVAEDGITDEDGGADYSNSTETK